MNENTKIKIMICCHKKCDLPNDPQGVFFPIQVGAALSSVDLGFQRDDQVNGLPCDNISSKNKSYCELSAIYWAWKNIKKIYPNLEYIGLNHYRRYFDFNHKYLFKDVTYCQEHSVNRYQLAPVSTIIEKTIVAKQTIYPRSNWLEYCHCHLSDDAQVLMRVISKDYPEYKNAAIKFFISNNSISHYNMFVMKWDYFDRYCNFLFGFLNKIEKQIDISAYSPKQTRIFGYMAERLLNIWLDKEGIVSRRLPIINYRNDRRDKSELWFMQRHIRAQIAHNMQKVRDPEMEWDCILKEAANIPLPSKK